MASPLFKINGGAAGAKHIGSYSQAITVEVADRTDVQWVQWEFFGKNRSSVVYPTIAPQGQGYIATFTLPAQVDGFGIGLGIRCTVNGGVVPGTSVVDPDLTTTSGIYVPANGGLHPPFIGETYEYDPTFGWGERIILNQTDQTVGGDLSGTVSFATLAKIAGKPLDDLIASPGDGQLLGYDAPAGKIKWGDPKSIWSDGSAGNLVISSGDVSSGTNLSPNYDTISFASGHTGKLFITSKLRCRVLDLRNANAGAIQANGDPYTQGFSGSNTSNCGLLLPIGAQGAQRGGGANGGLVADSYATVITGRGGGAGVYQTSAVVSPPAITDRLRRVDAAGSLVYLGMGGSSNNLTEGGGCAGYVHIRADVVITDGTTTAGCIQAIGGDGGANNAFSNGCGGSGGGAGGIIDLECNRRIGSAIVDLLNASGGKGGDRYNPGGSWPVLSGGGGDGGLIRTCVRGVESYTFGEILTTAINAVNAATGNSGGLCKATF
jgi:hypothetical protein